MIRKSMSPSIHDASAKGVLEDGATSVVLWLQEHTSLCNMIANAGSVDAETQARLKERLTQSADQGKQLVVELLAQKGGEIPPAFLSRLQEAAQNFVPVAGSARSQQSIPLSGGLRRLEDAGAMSAPRTGLRPFHAQGSHMPSQLLGNLVPSRTYLKKSGA